MEALKFSFKSCMLAGNYHWSLDWSIIIHKWLMRSGLTCIAVPKLYLPSSIKFYLCCYILLRNLTAQLQEVWKEPAFDRLSAGQPAAQRPRQGSHPPPPPTVPKTAVVNTETFSKGMCPTVKEFCLFPRCTTRLVWSCLIESVLIKKENSLLTGTNAKVVHVRHPPIRITLMWMWIMHAITQHIEVIYPVGLFFHCVCPWLGHLSTLQPVACKLLFSLKLLLWRKVKMLLD